MEEMLRKIWQALKPKSRSALGPKPRISDGSYPVGNRWPYDSYERDREMYRRHDEGYVRRNIDKENIQKEENDVEKIEKKEDKPDWKIRDEQYREDDERERRHEENYWGKSKPSSSLNASESSSSSTQDTSSEQK